MNCLKRTKLSYACSSQNPFGFIYYFLFNFYSTGNIPIEIYIFFSKGVVAKTIAYKIKIKIHIKETSNRLKRKSKLHQTINITYSHFFLQ